MNKYLFLHLQLRQNMDHLRPLTVSLVSVRASTLSFFLFSLVASMILNRFRTVSSMNMQYMHIPRGSMLLGSRILFYHIKSNFHLLGKVGSSMT